MHGTEKPEDSSEVLGRVEFWNTHIFGSTGIQLEIFKEIKTTLQFFEDIFQSAWHEVLLEKINFPDLTWETIQGNELELVLQITQFIEDILWYISPGIVGEIINFLSWGKKEVPAEDILQDMIKIITNYKMRILAFLQIQSEENLRNNVYIKTLDIHEIDRGIEAFKALVIQTLQYVFIDEKEEIREVAQKLWKTFVKRLAYFEENRGQEISEKQLMQDLNSRNEKSLYQLLMVSFKNKLSEYNKVLSIEEQLIIKKVHWWWYIFGTKEETKSIATLVPTIMNEKPVTIKSIEEEFASRFMEINEENQTIWWIKFEGNEFNLLQILLNNWVWKDYSSLIIELWLVDNTELLLLKGCVNSKLKNKWQIIVHEWRLIFDPTKKLRKWNKVVNIAKNKKEEDAKNLLSFLEENEWQEFSKKDLCTQYNILLSCFTAVLNTARSRIKKLWAVIEKVSQKEIYVYRVISFEKSHSSAKKGEILEKKLGAPERALNYLIEHIWEIVPREQFLDSVWIKKGSFYYVLTQVLDLLSLYNKEKGFIWGQELVYQNVHGKGVVIRKIYEI